MCEEVLHLVFFSRTRTGLPCVKYPLANTEERCRLKVDKKENIKPEGRNPLPKPDRPFEGGSLIS
jgi:hypothetical protein